MNQQGESQPANPETPEDRRISRRRLLRQAAATLGAAGVAAGAAWRLHDKTGKAGLKPPTPERLKNFFADVDYSAAAPRLSIARGNNKRIEAMVRAAVAGLDKRLGMKRFVKKGDVVLLKPNVAFDRAPILGATTNPEVVRAVIRLVREAGAKEILVADNPIESPETCFAKSKIQQVSLEEGATVMLPAEVHFRSIAVRGPNPDGTDYRPDPAKGEALGTWPIFWKPLEQADKVIGIPAIKDHNLCHASMGMKNWYGLLGGRRNQFHQAIDNIVSDLGMMMSPTLMIVDGTRVMMRNGPTGGRPQDVKEAHTIVASVDQLASDAWCYQHLLGRDPARLPYLDQAAAKFGREPYDVSKRFGQRDWTVYQNQGKIVETTVG